MEDMIPETGVEWWVILDSIWPDVMEIFENCGLSLSSYFFSIDKELNEPTPRSFGSYLSKLKADRDPILSRWMDKAYVDAPDDRCNLPSWRTFQHLVFERYLVE